MASSYILPTADFVLYDPGDDDEVIIPVDGFVFSETAAAGGLSIPIAAYHQMHLRSQ